MPRSKTAHKCPACGGQLSPHCICNNCEAARIVERGKVGRYSTCSTCGKSWPTQFICKSCNSRFLYEEVVVGETEGISCPSCKSEINAADLKCWNCGTNLKERAPEPVKRQPIARQPRRLRGDYDESDMLEIARIPGVGRERAEALCKAGYNALWKIKVASEYELSLIPEIGEKTARAIKSATNFILILPRKRSKEEMLTEVRTCRRCGLPTSIFSTKCLDCGSVFEAEDIDENVRRELERGGTKALIEFYGEAASRDKEDALLWLGLALSLGAGGRSDAAKKALARAKKIDPVNPRTKTIGDKLEALAAGESVRLPEPVQQPLPSAAKRLPSEPPREKESRRVRLESPPVVSGRASRRPEVIEPPPVEPSPPEDLPPKIDEERVAEDLRVLQELKEIAEAEPTAIERLVEAQVLEPESVQPRLVVTGTAPVAVSQRAVKQAAARPLLSGHGLVNGRGRVNGLINGNGFINGGAISEVELPRQNIFYRYIAVGVVLMIVFLMVNTTFNYPPGPRTTIQIDGSFADWAGVSSYHDSAVVDNPDANLTTYALFLERGTLYFMAEVQGIMFGDAQGYDAFYLMIDVDSDSSTGYWCGAIGADYMVAIDGTNATVGTSALLVFRGQDRLDWNRWSVLGAVRSAVSGSLVEGAVDTSLIVSSDLDKALVRFLVDDQEGHVAQSSIVVGMRYGALKVTQRSLSQSVSAGPTDFLELTFNLTGPPLTLYASDITISHSLGTQIDGLPNEIHLTQATPRVVTIRIDASTQVTGDVVEASLSSVKADRPVTMAGEGARGYVVSPPAGKRVDGVFADWPSPLMDADTMHPTDPHLDVEAYDANVTSETMFFYVRTVSSVLEGSPAPIRKQKLLAPPGGGGGPPQQPPRVTGESYARAYIDTDPLSTEGLFIEGIRAKYMMEARGSFGVIHSVIGYRWVGRWIIFSGYPQAAKAAREIEMSVKLSGLNLANASYFIEATNWRGEGDVTAVSNTRASGETRTRGIQVALMGSNTLLYAYPTSSPPTIDGDWSSSEWQDADSYDTGDMIIYTMQDGTNLYLAIRVKSDTVYNSGDYAEVAFDTDNGDETAPDQWDKKFSATDPDGSTVNEDYNGNGVGWDASYVSPYSWSANGKLDTDSGNYITYEFSIPFPEVWNTSSPSPGQIAGMAVHAHDDEGSGADYYWGSNNPNNPSTFGNLQIPEFQEVLPLLVVVPALIVLIRRRPGKINKLSGH